MKKTVKSLIIAASVAAVAGIGAVSFAKWTQTNTTNGSATGTTATLDAIGTITVTSLNVDATTGSVKLVPYDQENFDTTAYTNVWVIKVEGPTGVNYSYSYTVKQVTATSNDIGGDSTAPKLYVFSGESGKSAPTVNQTIATSGLTTDAGWIPLYPNKTADAVSLSSYTQSDESGAVNVIYVVMASDNHETDKNKSMKLEIGRTRTPNNSSTTAASS